MLDDPAVPNAQCESDGPSPFPGIKVMLAQQQTLTQLLELLQQAKMALAEAVRCRVESGILCGPHGDDDDRRRVLVEDR